MLIGRNFLPTVSVLLAPGLLKVVFDVNQIWGYRQSAEADFLENNNSGGDSMLHTTA